MKSRNIIVALECFVKKDGKYLMLHRNSDKKILPNVWLAPGGKIEFNEGLFECARREIREETGLEINNLRIKATGNGYMKDLNEEVFFHFVFADYAGGILKNNPPDGELRWLTVEEILKLDNLLAEIHQVSSFIFDDTDNVISYKAVYEKGNKLSSFVLEN